MRRALAWLRREKGTQYTIIEQFPEGSLGHAFLAERRSGRRRIKMLVRTVSRYEYRAFEESGLLSIDGASARSIGVTAYSDFGRWNRNLGRRRFFVARPLGDYSLREALGRISIKDRVEIAFSVTSALAELHSSGMVHGDISPENVMFYEGRWFLADPLPPRLATDLIKGRQFERRAPEVGEGVVDARSDIYGLGRLIYELFSGNPELGELGEGPPGVEEVVKAMLDTDRLARPDAALVREWFASEGPVAGSPRRFARQQVEEAAKVVRADLATDYSTGAMLGASAYSAISDDVGTVWKRLNDLLDQAGQEQTAPLLRRQTAIDAITAISGAKPERIDSKSYNRSIGEEHINAVELRSRLALGIDQPWIAEIRSRIVVEFQYDSSFEELRSYCLALGIEAPRSVREESTVEAVEQREVELANRLRSWLLQGGFVTSEEAETTLGLPMERLGEFVKMGIALGVEDHGDLLFPTFQFSDRGYDIAPIVLDVTRVLGPAGRGWGRWAWWRQQQWENESPADLVGRGAEANRQILSLAFRTSQSPL